MSIPDNVTRTIASNTIIGEIASSIASDGLGQSRYAFNNHTFPSDLANDYNGHYMVININVPTNASGGDLSGIAGSIPPDLRYNVLGTDYSKVDKLKFGEYRGIAPTNVGVTNPFDPRAAFLSGTRRIAESIAIQMPSAVVYNSQHIYEEISLTAIAGQVGKIAAQGVGALVAGAISGSLTRSIATSRGVNANYNPLGNIIGTGAKLMGFPINPKIEVLFTTTPQRQFAFELLFAPKNQIESESMERIIKTLRFHSAPELTSVQLRDLLNGSGNSLAAGVTGILPEALTNVGIPLYIPPAQFDITFYDKGYENLKIPRISTCVMERIEVDYSPTGIYSTFRNGHPVTARLSMAFRETEILHKARIAQGF